MSKRQAELEVRPIIRTAPGSGVTLWVPIWARVGTTNLDRLVNASGA